MHTRRVIKNSLWLIAQPLILNVVSIFATAYIVRILGQSNYGKFIFVFSFIAMFSPILNLGLRPITVREIAEDKTRAASYLGRMLVLKLILSFVVVCAVAIIVNIMRYPAITKTLVYIASLTIIFQAITSTLHDGFQAFERMHYVAISQFIGGFILTVLSVLILFIGYGIVELVAVYTLGSLITLMISLWFFFKNFPKPQLIFDVGFTKSNLRKGTPFFFPSLVGTASAKMGIIILSKMASDTTVGVYGAAATLTDRLNVIPDGICTAFFPSMATLYQESKQKAALLFEQFFGYLFLIGLPVAIGTTLLARHIITLLYGEKFISSIIILQIIIWSLFISFINSIQFWTLGAVHQEKKGAIIVYMTTPVYLLICLVLIPSLKEKGIAVASIIHSMLSLFITSCIIKKYLPARLLLNKFIGKVILANFIIGAIIYKCRGVNFFTVMLLSTVIYTGLIFVLKIVPAKDFITIWKKLFKIT